MSTATRESIPLDQLEVGKPQRIGPDDAPVCVLRLSDNEVIAFTDSCPHRGHPLSEGKCTHGVLRCALHGWEFAVPGGEAVSPRAPFGLELLDVQITPTGNVEVSA